MDNHFLMTELHYHKIPYDVYLTPYGITTFFLSVPGMGFGYFQAEGVKNIQSTRNVFVMDFCNILGENFRLIKDRDNGINIFKLK